MLFLMLLLMCCISLCMMIVFGFVLVVVGCLMNIYFDVDVVLNVIVLLLIVCGVG